MAELVSRVFDRIEDLWVEGAELPPADLEDAIDRAARVGYLAGLATALEAYERAARDVCDQHSAALRERPER